MITVIFSRRKEFPQPISNQLGIISWLPPYFDAPLKTLEVNAVGLQDSDYPTNLQKGDKVTINKSIFAHMQKIQSIDAYNWTVRPYMLWINRRYVDDCFGAPWVNDDGSPIDILPRAECISGFGNFVEILDTVNGYHLIKAIPNTTDFSKYDETFNWFNHPELWVKQSARNKAGGIYNVGTGYDAYFPLLKAKEHLWIHSSFCELFPPSPETGGFILQGCSVYTATMQPLRLARKPGELIEPTGWHLNTRGVVPAK
jgi:hypothetical protein